MNLILEQILDELIPRVGDLIISSSLDEKLLSELRANFEETFDSNWTKLKFAVRSSAIGNVFIKM